MGMMEFDVYTSVNVDVEIEDCDEDIFDINECLNQYKYSMGIATTNSISSSSSSSSEADSHCNISILHENDFVTNRVNKPKNRRKSKMRKRRNVSENLSALPLQMMTRRDVRRRQRRKSSKRMPRSQSNDYY